MKLSGFRREFVRPTVYRAFTRLVYGTTATLLIDFFIKDALRPIKSYGFTLCAALAALGAWLSYLRMDGMKLPRKPHIKLPKRKQPTFFYSDMAEHIDDELDNYDELEPEEQSLVLFVADLVAAAVFANIS